MQILLQMFIINPTDKKPRVAFSFFSRQEEIIVHN